MRDLIFPSRRRGLAEALPPLPAPSAQSKATAMASGSKSPPAMTAEHRSWITRLRSSIVKRARGYFPPPDRSIPMLDQAKLLAQALLSERGEASGAALARELHACLRALGAEERLAFQHFLAEGFAPDAARLRAAAEAYLAAPTPEQAARLAEAADPPRQELLRRMNMSSGGTAALVAMRKDLLGRLRAEPALKPLDADLRHLLGSWFNRGFLELRRISWRTPAMILEKLITYEAVHEIRGWEDLRRRLAPDRRCFGFFHPALPDDPLIFVEVALVQGLATAVQPLLTEDGDELAAREREAAADTAIFYSISNCQDGLRGISFGNLLIKHVVEELKSELPHIKRFSTLSPVPGFRRWVEKQRPAGTAAAKAAIPSDDKGTASAPGDLPVTAAALPVLKEEGWWERPDEAEAARRPLLRLCAVYLTGSSGGKGTQDPVARFHLGNGARLERINWLGNTAPRGIAESYGLMVNYLYDPPTIEANHEAYARDGVVARSPEVDALMGAAPRP